MSHASSFSDSRPGKFRLDHEDIVFEIPMELSDISVLNVYQPSFLDTLSPSTEGPSGKGHHRPASALVLALEFLRHLVQSEAAVTAVRVFLRAFEEQFLQNTNIHSILSGESVPAETKERCLKGYFQAREHLSRKTSKCRSALIESARIGTSKVIWIFGGQGLANAMCVRELRSLNTTYNGLLKRLIDEIDQPLESLCKSADTAHFFEGRIINLKRWLATSEEIHDEAFLGSAAVSLPILGILDLAHYCVICQMLGKSPGEVASTISAVSGHSQGIVIAAVVACSGSWDSFYENARFAVEMLFWIGFESHHGLSNCYVPADTIQDSLAHDEGRPSPMLSIRGIERIQVNQILHDCNIHLPLDRQVHLALSNCRSNYVVAGPPASLCGLNRYLREIAAPADMDQARIAYSQRRPVIDHQFLPISAPFHSRYLSRAAIKAKARLQGKSFNVDQVQIPLLHTATGQNIWALDHSDLPGVLTDAITTESVDFPAILSNGNPTHFVVFGLGRLPELVKRNREGYGQRIISGNQTDVPGQGIGSRSELFSSTLPPRELPWGEAYAPRLVKTLHGELVADTKLSRLLQVPPVITAGMTPTTVHWDFVAAIMDAGYYAELAGGGYRNEGEMDRAIRTLALKAPPGRGLAVNLIYINPEAIAWQIRLVTKLIQRGIPIDGVTIGAGVPSAEVARGYIDDIGLKYISFKPGSIDAIIRVLEIADDRPHFPIVLQWTGGRGGGHHSFEDFHAPIFTTYHDIRKRRNVILVAGSGFGGGEDTYPYLSGAWSQPLGYPAMPFDGVLLGSRMMVCSEAHTSPQAKQLIYSAPGVRDQEWERSYSGIAGGVITVKSEMGQPIHKIANRGVLLWAEMDRTIFSLPRSKIAEELSKKKDYIISRLNNDYAKPWFGVDSTGSPVDLVYMTYTGVLKRMIQLMYVSHQKRWIHSSYMHIVYDFASRTLQRTSSQFPLSLEAFEEPDTFLQTFTTQCPRCDTQKLHPDDARFFIQRCKRRGQKPVNFIPTLDEDFEYWFKKDSLWQSEDLDAVIDQDAGRVCILQGPVAVQHSVKKDEEAKHILDRISQYHVDSILRNFYKGNMSLVPHADNAHTTSLVGQVPGGHCDENTVCTHTFHFQPEDTVNWLSVLDSGSFWWLRTLLSETYIIQDGKRKKNPLQQVFNVQEGQTVSIDHSSQRVVLSDSANGHQIVNMQMLDNGIVAVDLNQPPHFAAAPAVLTLQYTIIANGLTSSVVELTEQRNARIKSLYSNLWLGYEIDPTTDPHTTFTGSPITLTREIFGKLHEILNLSAARTGNDSIPMDAAVVIAWEVLVKPLLLASVDGDLLQLVHRSNSIEYCTTDEFRLGDVLHSSSRIQSIGIEEAGKSVVVKATIRRDETDIASITSSFLMRGTYTDFSTCFERIVEPETDLTLSSPVDEDLLRSREWFHLNDHEIELVGKTVTFKLETAVTWESKDKMECLRTEGPVFARSWRGDLMPIGHVSFEARGCKANPVSDFLQRKGRTADQRKLFNVSSQFKQLPEVVEIPRSNKAYSLFSRDFNPIHISETFAQYAELPGTITHGMYTSAAVRSAVQQCVVDGDPGRFRRWSCSFEGMVLPGDKLDIEVDFIGMVQGRQLLRVAAINSSTQEVVLRAEAEVNQAPTAYVFTGQGSQSVGMGMKSYQSSPEARKIWDDADKFFVERYGWSVLELVKQNPKSLTIRFRGHRGRQVKQNYMAMTIDSHRPDGSIVMEPIIKDLTEDSTSYTFSDPRGLLFSTQFAQPTIVLLERAAMADLKARGVVPEGACFAGHSLGEYGALAAFAEFMPFEDLLSVVFYRGLAMQLAIERDHEGRTNFSMAAVNPSRVSKFFGETALKRVVEAIATSTNALLEIVNFNVEGEQYVCAGTLENLHTLATTLDYISRAPDSEEIARAIVTDETEHDRKDVLSFVHRFVSEAQQLPTPITLKRSTAMIPLQGIDVPFHSAHLRHGVPSYRNFLRERIGEGNVDASRLVGRWIPNVMGKPFSLSRTYIEDAYWLTASPVLGELLAM
ncbi:acyl transferase domain-containing protein [Aspergillus floccosus]